VTLAVVLAAGTAAVLMQSVQAARAASYPNLEGAWQGVMLLEEDGVAAGEGAQTQIVLKFTKTNGEYAGTFDVIELGRKDIPMGKIIYKFPDLQIQRTPREFWDLKLNEDATKMVW